MLRRTFLLRPTVPSESSAVAAAAESSTAAINRRAQWRYYLSIAMYCGAGAAAAASLPIGYWYTTVYRPKALLVESVLRQPRPERNTKVFTTGKESITSVSDLATDETSKIFFYANSVARLFVFGWRSLYFIWLVVKYSIRKRFFSPAAVAFDVGVSPEGDSKLQQQQQQQLSPLPESKKHKIAEIVQKLSGASAPAAAGGGAKEDDDPALVEIGEELARVFNAMGGAYVKLGQWSATRSDVFPKEVCDALERLFDKTAPHPWSETEKMLEAAKLVDVFESIDKEPVSSGTIAQVYHARLKQDAVLSDHDRVSVLSAALRAQNKRARQQQQQNASENSSKAEAEISPAAAAAESAKSSEPGGGVVDVAVKVSHPRIRLIILEDMQALHWATQLINLVVPGASYLGMTQAVEEFAGLLYSQLDLLREAENLNEFRYNFRTSESTVFPRPFLSLTTSDVLVETFEYGVALNSKLVTELTGLEEMMEKTSKMGTSSSSTSPRIARTLEAADSSSSSSSSSSSLSFTYSPGGATFLPQSPLQKSDFADLGPLAIEMFLKMVFEHNLVHGDLHPGNILIRIVNADGTYSLSRKGPNSHSQVVVLDPGLVTSMSSRERDNFIALFTCVATGDGDLGARLMLERSPEQHCSDVPAFLAQMKEVFERVTPRGLTIDDLDLATIMREILETMRQHRVRIDMNFASLAATVALGESLGRRLVPDFNLFDEAMPFLLHCLKSHELHYMVSKLQEIYLTS